MATLSAPSRPPAHAAKEAGNHRRDADSRCHWLFVVSARSFFGGFALCGHPVTDKALGTMRRPRTDIIEAIKQRLSIMYEGIIAEGVPVRLAALLTTSDSDTAAGSPAM
jgi:hypothetical protein